MPFVRDGLAHADIGSATRNGDTPTRAFAIGLNTHALLGCGEPKTAVVKELVHVHANGVTCTGGPHQTAFCLFIYQCLFALFGQRKDTDVVVVTSHV